MKNEVVFGLLLVVVLGALGYFFLVREDISEPASSPATTKRSDVDEAPALRPPPPAPLPPPKNETGEPFPREAGLRQRRPPVMDTPATPSKKPAPPPKPVAPPPAPKPKKKPYRASVPVVSDRATPPELVLRGEVVPPEEVDEIMVWGTDSDSLMASIQEQHEEFVRCYDAWLEVEPNLAGRLKVGLTIGQATEEDSLASVIALDVADSDLDHAVFEGCILGALQDLNYEPTESNIVVNYPLRFRVEEEEE